MDNYYTSPETFIALRANGLFARGTCRKDREHFPKAVTFTTVEADKKGRGVVKVATNEEHGS